MQANPGTVIKIPRRLQNCLSPLVMLSQNGPVCNFFCLEYNDIKSLFRNEVGSNADNCRYQSSFSHSQSCGTLLELYGYH